MTDLTGRRAIVTGATSLLGKHIAHALVDAGAHVMIADRDRNAVRRIAKTIGAEPWSIDLSDPLALSATDLDVDILVNNPAVPHTGNPTDFSAEQLSFLIRVMLEVPYLLVRSVLDGMRERRFGRIITISSTGDVPSSVYSAMFTAASHGLEHVSRITALEGGAHGVTSNVIDPGFVHTPTTNNRHVNPTEVADLALWLASRDADLISGTTYSLQYSRSVAA